MASDRGGGEEHQALAPASSRARRPEWPTCSLSRTNRPVFLGAHSQPLGIQSLGPLRETPGWARLLRADLTLGGAGEEGFSEEAPPLPGVFGMGAQRPGVGGTADGGGDSRERPKRGGEKPGTPAVGAEERAARLRRAGSVRSSGRCAGEGGDACEWPRAGGDPPQAASPGGQALLSSHVTLRTSARACGRPCWRVCVWGEAGGPRGAWLAHVVADGTHSGGSARGAAGP